MGQRRVVAIQRCSMNIPAAGSRSDRSSVSNPSRVPIQLAHYRRPGAFVRSEVSDRRGALLVAALAALRLKSREPELAIVHALLDCWHGLGLVAVVEHVARARACVARARRRRPGEHGFTGCYSSVKTLPAPADAGAKPGHAPPGSADVPSPEPPHAALGRPSAQVVADAVAGRPRGHAAGCVASFPLTSDVARG